MRVLTNGALVLALAVLLGGCAKPSYEIGPVLLVSARSFSGVSCPDLTAERGKLQRSLLFASLRQDHLREADKTRTLGFPTPLGTPFEDDHSLEIARLKGELQALDEEMSAHCGPDYG